MAKNEKKRTEVVSTSRIVEKSICFIYKEEESFEAFYIKSFFEWIGFECGEYLHNRHTDIFENSGNLRFEFVIDFNHTYPNEEGLRKKMKNSTWISLDLMDGEDAYQLLKRLLQMMFDIEMPILLAKIWHQYELIAVLYEYNDVLDFSTITRYKFLKLTENALSEVEALLKENPNDDFKAHVLYAKYNMQLVCNSRLVELGFIRRYDIFEFFENVNEIYKVDYEFYMVEFLKIKASAQSCMTQSYILLFVGEYMKSCKIPCCTDKIFNKYVHYYHVVNRNIDKHYMIQQAYNFNKNNLNVLFRIGDDCKNQKGEEKTAEIFFREVLNKTKKDPNFMLSIEFEYVYKSCINISKLVEQHQKNEWEKEAEIYLDFLCNIAENNNKDKQSFSIIEKMYGVDSNDIALAIIARISMKTYLTIVNKK